MTLPLGNRKIILTTPAIYLIAPSFLKIIIPTISEWSKLLDSDPVLNSFELYKITWIRKAIVKIFSSAMEPIRSNSNLLELDVSWC